MNWLDRILQFEHVLRFIWTRFWTWILSIVRPAP